MKYIIQLRSSLAASATADEGEDNEKEVDDIQVQLQRSKDVFLGTELVAALLAADDHLSVKDEELQCKASCRWPGTNKQTVRLKLFQ